MVSMYRILYRSPPSKDLGLIRLTSQIRAAWLADDGKSKVVFKDESAF